MLPDASSADNENSRSANPVADAAIATTNRFASFDGVPPQNEIITVATTAYLDAIDAIDPPSPETIEKQLLASVNGIIKMVNPKASTSQEKLPLKRVLTSWQIAQVLHRVHVIKEVVPGGMSLDKGVGVLAIYQPCGVHRGIYRPADFAGPSNLESLAQAYNPSMTDKEYKEVLRLVRMSAERRPETLDCDLLPMLNTIFNYRTNERIPFSPEYVFLAKMDTALPEMRPELPRIRDEQVEGGYWDIESWTEDTHPEPGMAEHIWKVRGAMLRQRVNWKKAFLYSDPLGSTGKGTENELIRGLVGADNCVSITLDAFASQFGKQPLIGALANIVDELPVGGYYRDLSDFKATITHDRITIDRKNKEPISFKPNVGSLFNLNSAIEASDKSGSLLRRFQIIPFTKRFIGATDNPRIKEDYVLRREVREYIAFKVLVDMPKFWDITTGEPELVRQALDAYRLETQSVAAWTEECLDQFVGKMVAFGQAHAHYNAWTKERSATAKPVDQNTFTAEVKLLLDPEEWIVPTTTGKNGRTTDKQLTTRTWITVPEPLLDEYHYVDAVSKWQPSPRNFAGVYEVPKSAPRLSRGFVRRDAWEQYEAARQQNDPNTAMNGEHDD